MQANMIFPEFFYEHNMQINFEIYMVKFEQIKKKIKLLTKKKKIINSTDQKLLIKSTIGQFEIKNNFYNNIKRGLKHDNKPNIKIDRSLKDLSFIL